MIIPPLTSTGSLVCRSFGTYCTTNLYSAEARRFHAPSVPFAERQIIIMEITKELKEKLLNANSEEEVKALLGEEITEEEAALLFQEIRKRKEADDLKALDDGNLENVAGGIKIVSTPTSKIVAPILRLWQRIFGD